ncbi:hypothetical protein DH2020_005870 [Rehmannia glutinosa]|uniref:Uncharacterized protein n=1 Tax=Rehmannia glutinosa TaxID=99300 RepID=A0ABR0XHC1_REHGL
MSRGKATFCSRFVRTHKYIMERDLEYSIFPNLFALFNNKLTASVVLTVIRIITCQLNPFIKGIGTANTSLSLFGGRLFALVEYNLPYSIKLTSDGDIITIGRHDFNSSEFFMNMTAHPKIDPETGEAFAFKYFVIPPFLSFFRIDPNGRKTKEVPIFSMKGASFVHDFAVTKNFAVFPDVQIVINPLQIMRGRTIMSVDRDKVPRLGVIGRYAEDESEMYWIDVPGFNMLHVVNTWDEDDGDTIVIMASNVLSIEHALERMDLINFSMEKITIDAKAKKIVNKRPVSATSLDFGTINPQYAGDKNRYVYAAVMETMPKITGVVKIDLSLLSADSSGDCTVASRLYGAGCYRSEPIFVAREHNNPATEEDDGYLLSYVHNENTKESQFLVMDAKSPSFEIVAAVKLPRRVPYGFHSIFVKESDLHKL